MKFSIGRQSTTTWTPFSAGKLGYVWSNDTQKMMALNTSAQITLSNVSKGVEEVNHTLGIYHTAPSLCLTDISINTIYNSVSQSQDTNAIWLDADDVTPEIGLSNSTGDNITLGINSDGNAIINNGTGAFELITTSLADNASFNLADGRSGIGIITFGDGEEYAWFSFTSAGVVTLITNSDNVTTTLTTNDKLNIGDGGTYVTIENTFTATKQLTLQVTYNL